MAFFSYLLKLKRDLRLAFGAHFLHDFFHKIVSYLILYQWTKFQCHDLLLSQDIKQNVLLSSYLDRYFLDQPLKQWLTRKKRNEDKNTKN